MIKEDLAYNLQNKINVAFLMLVKYLTLRRVDFVTALLTCFLPFSPLIPSSPLPLHKYIYFYIYALFCVFIYATSSFVDALILLFLLSSSPFLSSPFFVLRFSLLSVISLLSSFPNPPNASED